MNLTIGMYLRQFRAGAICSKKENMYPYFEQHLPKFISHKLQHMLLITGHYHRWRLTIRIFCFYECQCTIVHLNPYPTAFPYGNGTVLHFYQQQESSTTKTVNKVINKGLKTYV